MLTTIFFDAGNTLVFANLERTLAALHARGVRPRPEQLHAAERQAKTELDRANTSRPLYRPSVLGYLPLFSAEIPGHRRRQAARIAGDRQPHLRQLGCGAAGNARDTAEAGAAIPAGRDLEFRWRYGEASAQLRLGGMFPGLHRFRPCGP